MRAAIGTAHVLPTRGVPHERKTGLIRAASALATLRVRDGGLDLLRRAA